MASPGSVTGWKIPSSARDALLERFPPRYAKVVADHVTLAVGANAQTPLPPAAKAEVVGRADDGASLECLVVAIDGTCERPDGSTFHITWSLGAGRKARESNDVLRRQGWTALDRPVPLELDPARF